jgi:hypothetical protein
MNIRYRVTLSTEERRELQALVSGGKGAARKIKRAQILLAADAGSKSTDGVIARTLGSSTSTVYRTKQRFVEEGLERALTESPRPGVGRKLSASDEANLDEFNRTLVVRLRLVLIHRNSLSRSCNGFEGGRRQRSRAGAGAGCPNAGLVTAILGIADQWAPEALQL